MKYCPECTHELQDKVVNGVDRKVCPAQDCGFVFWGNPVPVVAALIQYQDKIILARNSTWPTGLFSLITGYLEKNEAPANAILREIKEEIGLDGVVEGFVGHYPFPKLNQIILAFWVSASGDVVTNHEIDEIQLVGLDELKERSFGKLTITRAIVDDWLKLI